MARRSFLVTCAAAAAAVLVPGFSRALSVVHAQEGHPLAGTWHGTWGPDAAHRHDVTLVLDYDGKAIVGMMNPGPDAIHFTRATLDPDRWAVHLEAAPKQGAPVIIDAVIQDVTSRHRSLVGTFSQGSDKGDFKAARDE
jgi:hypothetical protein